jgi:hypothetical protein
VLYPVKGDDITKYDEREEGCTRLEVPREDIEASPRDPPDLSRACARGEALATSGPSQTAPGVPSSGRLGADKVRAAEGGCGCSGAAEAGSNGGGPATRTFIYTVGNIEPRFPNLSVEKEFAQVTGRANTEGLTDRQALQRVLSERGNRYLARQLCWVHTIAGMETYLLLPRDPADFDLLVASLRPTPRATDLDVVIGVRGPIAPPVTQ